MMKTTLFRALGYETNDYQLTSDLTTYETFQITDI